MALVRSKHLKAYLSLSVGAGVFGVADADAAVQIWNGTPITGNTTSGSSQIWWNLSSMTAGLATPPTGAFGINYRATNYVYNIPNSARVQWGVTTGNNTSRLGTGATIDSSLNWSPTNGFTYFSRTNWTYSASTPWATRTNNTQGFGAFRFDYSYAPGTYYYGWAQLTYNNGNQHSLTLENFAWNDTANQAITTAAVPEPAGLGLLALGAAGVAAIRRARKSA